MKMNGIPVKEYIYYKYIMLIVIFSVMVKYLLQGAAIAVAAHYIPKKNLGAREIANIAMTGALVLFLLDLLAPTIGRGTRTGAGFGIGKGLVEPFRTIAPPDNEFYDEDYRPKKYEKGQVSFPKPPTYQLHPPNPAVNPHSSDIQ